MDELAMTPSESQAFRLLLLLAFLSFLSSLFYFTVLEQKLHLQKYHADVPQRNITILLWHWPFGRSYRLDGDKCLQMYNISHCSLSDNTSALSSADVVVFHHHELSNGRSALPLNVDRPASQHWVWMSMEPPVNNQNLMQLNGLFNWTMTYRRDADIPIPYGKTIRREDKATYEALAPPGSFIHVEDFKSIEHLAAYLKHVAADRQAYEQYFQWRYTHRIKTYTDWRERLCQICVKYPSLPTNRIYQDLESW
ncbi:hypothetical protein INR49_028042, partial [Caranx melampygus]